MSTRQTAGALYDYVQDQATRYRFIYQATMIQKQIRCKTKITIVVQE